MVESSGEGICMLDEQERATYANAALAEMLGYTREELVGSSLRDFLTAETAPEAQDILAGLREGLSSQFEFPIRAKDGHTVWALVATGPLWNADGSYAGSHAMLTDVTERRAAAVERAHLAAIVQSSADAIVSMSMDGVIESWNDSAEKLYGYTAAEAIGQDASRLLARDVAQRRRMLALVASGSNIDRFETQSVTKSGRVLDISLTISGVRDSQGRLIGIAGIARDIGARRRMERDLRHHAEHDPLTGLFNRRRLTSELDLCMTYARRYRRAGAVLAIDIDNFSLINDSRGHDVGDQMLKAVGELLLRTAGTTDIVGRLGGDAFAVVLPDASAEDGRSLAADIRSLLFERPTGPPIYASIGISLFTPEQDLTADDALIAADIALHEAKAAGRDQARVFEPGSGGTVTWVERIRTALAEERFVLFGQPILDLRNDRIARHELLIRMLGDDGEVIAPGEFIPTAERFGLIGEIDRWVVAHALRLAMDGRRVAVNLAGPSIGDERILALVSGAINDGLDPGNVTFEITETAAVSNFESAVQFAGRLSGIGCELALDDFGTGFGSFTYLKHLNMRYLKIDVEFVRELVISETDRKVVAAIVDIARSLGKRTVAEGVEDAATLAAVRSLGVDFAQGFHIGYPAPLEPLSPAPPT
jgi:diguanylate cyclase (GGDEF)-like protein/PAS domain S-box-containing protein